MKAITPSNARTQSIESAVEELSKRESITMTDVREFMDTLLSQKIPTGKKAKYTDPNGEEHEYEVKAPISDFYNYKSDEKEIYCRALENILKDKKFFHELPENGKVSDVLKWAALNANFIETKDIGNFCIWLLETIVEIKKTCKNGFVDKTRQNKTQLEFNSTTKGSGKSHFIEAFVKATQEAGIEAKYEVSLPEGGFYNTLEETKNLIVGYKERVYQKVDEATMMSIGRHEDYTYIEKGKMAINVPANAITIGSTNGNPYAKDDRCYRIINCLPASYEKRMEILQTSTNFLQTLGRHLTRCNTTIYAVPATKVCNFVNLFKSVIKENNENNNNQICNKLQNYKIPGVSTLVDVVSDFTHDYDLLEFVSVKGLYKQWEKQTGKHLEGMQKFLSFEKPISEALNFLYSRGLVKGRGPSDDMKRQYDIFSILEDLKTLDISEEVTTIEGDILKAAAEWERIIKMAEDFENNDPDKPKAVEMESLKSNKEGILGKLQEKIESVIEKEKEMKEEKKEVATIGKTIGEIEQEEKKDTRKDVSEMSKLEVEKEIELYGTLLEREKVFEAYDSIADDYKPENYENEDDYYFAVYKRVLNILRKFSTN